MYLQIKNHGGVEMTRTFYILGLAAVDAQEAEGYDIQMYG